jgi:hypothetical protein
LPDGRLPDVASGLRAGWDDDDTAPPDTAPSDTAPSDAAASGGDVSGREAGAGPASLSALAATGLPGR